MSEQASQQSIKELISDKTSPEEFEALVATLLNEDDKRILGENALFLATHSLLILSVFAPEPATLDKAGYKYMVSDDEDETLLLLDNEMIDQLIQFDIRVGVLKEMDDLHYAVDSKSKELLEMILDRTE